MGWKSTVDITRKKAIQLIIDEVYKNRYSTLSNEQLANTLEAIGFGDNTELPYYGRNFIVRDNESELQNN